MGLVDVLLYATYEGERTKNFLFQKLLPLKSTVIFKESKWHIGLCHLVITHLTFKKLTMAFIIKAF